MSSEEIFNTLYSVKDNEDLFREYLNSMSDTQFTEFMEECMLFDFSKQPEILSEIFENINSEKLDSLYKNLFVSYDCQFQVPEFSNKAVNNFILNDDDVFAHSIFYSSLSDEQILYLANNKDISKIVAVLDDAQIEYLNEKCFKDIKLETKFYDLKKKLGQLSTLQTDMIMRDMLDTDEYRAISDEYNIINEQCSNCFNKIHEQNLNRNLVSDLNTCLDMLEPLGNDFALGKHTCDMHHEIKSSFDELSESILSNGLKLEVKDGGIAAHVHILGNKNIKENLNEMLDAFYKRALDSKTGGVIVAVPNYMIDANYNKQFIGQFPNDLNEIAKYDVRLLHNPINNFVQKDGTTPSEFILGVVSYDKSGEIKFHKNDRFITQLSIE